MRLLATFFALGSVLCVHADMNPSAKARSIFRNRSLVFESRDGRTFASWTPDQRILVGPQGWDIALSTSQRVAMSIVGAKDTAKDVKTEQPVASKNVYFHGDKKDWYAPGTGYHKVRYPHVLPGIDVAYYGDGQKLEFDLIVAPGADPSKVRLHFEGQDKLEVDADGQLRLYAGGAPLVQKMPAVYQKQAGGMRLVDARYMVRPDGDVAFTVGAYDHSQPLVIDPVVDYTVYIGDVARDEATRIVTDKAGFIYIAGTTLSTAFPVYGQAAQNSAQGQVDVFLSKLDPNQAPENALVYSSFLGGAADDVVSALMLDSAGYVYLAGTTQSTNFPIANGAYPTSLGNGDGFVTKIDTKIVDLASLQYSTYLGGTGQDVITSGAIRSDGFVALTGYTASTDFPMVGTAYQSSNAGGYDAFVAWIEPGGNLIFSSYLGGGQTDAGQAIAIDDDGGLVVAGFTASPAFPMAGTPYSGGLSDLSDLFVSKMTLTGQLVYSSFFGGTDLEEVNGIARYSSGRFAITGYTNSSDFPITGNAAQKVFKGGSDAFVSILDVNAAGLSSLVYSTYYGGSGPDSAYDLKVDASGLITICGYTISLDLPVTANALQTKYQGGGSDAFVAQIRPGSALQLSTYLGGPSSDAIYAIALMADGHIWLAGSTSSVALPTDNSDKKGGDVGNVDAVVLSISNPAK